MADLRFPSNVQNDNKPYVLFSTHKARYNNTGNAIDTNLSGNSVALYLPAAYNVSDILRYATEATGIIGNAFERFESGNGLTASDLVDAAEAIAIDKAAAIAGAIGASAAAAAGGGAAGTVISAATGAGVVGNIKAEALKSYQKTINPREFMLFQAPSIRQFGFSFTFIPSDSVEADAVPKIIQFFREASYPDLHAHGLQYTFPEAFNIRFSNSNKIIKIPEVVCTGTNITYNPNSISYFLQDNLPVEITLQLSFQELQPINKDMVKAGY